MIHRAFSWLCSTPCRTCHNCYHSQRSINNKARAHMKICLLFRDRINSAWAILQKYLLLLRKASVMEITASPQAVSSSALLSSVFLLLHTANALKCPGGFQICPAKAGRMSALFNSIKQMQKGRKRTWTADYIVWGRKEEESVCKVFEVHKVFRYAFEIFLTIGIGGRWRRKWRRHAWCETCSKGKLTPQKEQEEALKPRLAELRNSSRSSWKPDWEGGTMVSKRDVD